MTDQPAPGAIRRDFPFAHVTAIAMGRGLGTLARILRIYARHPWQVGIAMVATLLAAGLQLAVPMLLGRAVDAAQGLVAAGSAAGAAEAALWTTAWLLLAVSVLRGVFTLLQNYFAEAVGHHASYELRLACYEKMQRLGFSFHDGVHSGDLIMMGILDIEGVRNLFAAGLIRLVLLVMLVGIGAYMVLSADLVLGLLSLSFVPFVAWRSVATHLKLRAAWMILQQRLAALSRVMEENLGGIRVVRAFAAQMHELGKFDVASAAAMELAHERVDIRTRNTSAMNFSFFVAMGLVLLVGGHKVLAGETTVGALASFLTFMTILQLPVRQMGMLTNAFARASTTGQRLFELLDRDLDIRDVPEARPLRITEGTLSFSDVGFAYPGNPEHRVLDGISFVARRGETIGIVGAPGSGKTTIANLIPRFYDVAQGTIAIDGQDISTVTLDSLRRRVGLVQQENFLFTTSIENNIAYGDPWAEDHEIAAAADSAQLGSYISELPQGFGTVVGERGASLSGGQRQRMSIARSIILKPAVLIFDDSTAAVDAGTEQRIRRAMRASSTERVTIIISHRLSSLMHADQILLLDGGRIVERGTHLDLIAKDGRYKALFDLQGRPADADFIEAAQ